MKQKAIVAALSIIAVIAVRAAWPNLAAAEAQTIVVTSTADSGPGTLRDALEQAPPGTTITFDPAAFPPDRPSTIGVLSPLPRLHRGQITIDASDAGVILDGSRLPREESISGLVIESSGNVVRGLQIFDFPEFGVLIIGASQDNVIGGDRTLGAGPTGQGNVISLCGLSGVSIREPGTGHNVVQGNYIGTDATGTTAQGNGFHGVEIVGGAQRNLVGGQSPGERNVISGNGRTGVFIQNGETTNNTVSGNYIGTDASGTAAIPNGEWGVDLGDQAENNLIGGDSPGEGNLISGNGSGGVFLQNRVSGNRISGNYVGTDASGKAAVGNSGFGIVLGSGAQENVVGGTRPEAGNVISGNDGDGVMIEGSETTANVVSGNYVGTDVTGMAALGNGERGVFILSGAHHNVVAGNVISGNAIDGVPIEGSGTMYNTVRNNYVGTNSLGTAVIGNGGDGVYISRGAQFNTVTGNVIGGNLNGVQIRNPDTAHNTISHNYIGTDADGKVALGNQVGGIIIDDGAGPNTIGPGNIIAYNDGPGVKVRGPETLGNTLTANSIHDNQRLGIVNQEGGNTGLPAPLIQYASGRFVRGTAPPGSAVEVFSDEGSDGRVFEGKAVADQAGFFTFRMPAGRFTGPNVAATATDAEGNTSEFSSAALPPAPRVTRELPGIVAPTQVSVAPKVVATNLGLALFCVLFFGLTSNIFNSILKDYREELLRLLAGPIGHRLGRALRRGGTILRGVAAKGWGRLVLMWLVVLLVTSLIESFLDPESGIFSLERLALVVTLFVSATVVSGLELGSDLFARRRWSPTVDARGKVQWLGIGVAVGCVIVSRVLDFRPGYLYGIVGAIYLMPRFMGIAASGKRAVLVVLTILAGGLILWLATAFLPAALTDLEPLFLTVFLISLQGAFFELFPLAVTDGGDIWNWKRGIWFLLFLAVFFAFYHFVLNPNASDVQALQQNGVRMLLLLIVVFGLATLTLWLLFPFRLRRKRAG